MLRATTGRSSACPCGAVRPNFPAGAIRLATPNYSYEKRQRELAKKRKAEEKRQRKLNGPAQSGAAEEGAPPDEGQASGDAPPADAPDAQG